MASVFPFSNNSVGVKVKIDLEKKASENLMLPFNFNFKNIREYKKANFDIQKRRCNRIVLNSENKLTKQTIWNYIKQTKNNEIKKKQKMWLFERTRVSRSKRKS